MTRLMVIPLEEKGPAILIVARHGDAAVMGFVATSTLAELLDRPLSACECLAVVERHLPTFEQVLVRKSSKAAFVETSIACVEIETADLAGIAVACERRT